MQVLKKICVLFWALLLSGCEQLLPIQSDGYIVRSGTTYDSARQDYVREDASFMIVDAQDSFKTAMLLPLTGKASVYGQGLKNAAMMALEDAHNDRLVVRFYDTQSTPSGAESAVQQAISDGNGLILGPLMSEEVSAVTPTARRANVPVISFSTSPSVLQEGIYTLGLLGNEQIERIISYASAQGRTRIALFVPDTASGMNMVQSAVESASKAGVSVVSIGFYPAETMDFTDLVQKMTGGSAETVDFDAVLIPESGHRLKSLSAMLGYYDVAYPDVLFMGTSVWENTPLSKETTLYHAVYPVLSRVHGTYFNKKYESLFGEIPNSLYSFAYDGVALASALSRKNPAEMYANITDSDGYIGLNGVFGIYRDGQNRHSMEIVEVTSDGLKTVESAPEKLDMTRNVYFSTGRSSFGRPKIYGKDASLVYQRLYGYSY